MNVRLIYRDVHWIGTRCNAESWFEPVGVRSRRASRRVLCRDAQVAYRDGRYFSEGASAVSWSWRRGSFNARSMTVWLMIWRLRR